MYTPSINLILESSDMMHRPLYTSI